MTHIQQRRGPALEWAAQNPVLFDGEAGHEDDTGKWKLGDGATAWNALPYKAGVDSVAGKTGIVALGVGDVSGAAPLVDPAFTGSPTAPTPAPGSDSTRVATTEWVRDFAAPAATSAPIQSPAFTGNPTAPTPTTEDNDTSVATTGFVKNQGYAALASPALTGTPTAPTPATADRDTSLATTDFVHNVVEASGDWVAYSPVVSPWTLDATQKWFRYRRVGNTLSVAGAFKATAFPDGVLQIGLPAGLIAYMGPLAQYRAVGTWSAIREGLGRYSDVVTLNPVGSALFFAVDNDAPFFVQFDNPVTWAPGDAFSFQVEFEIDPA